MDAKQDSIDEVSGALEFAERFLALRYPQCAAAILAGSRANGSATPSSDYDIILLFGSLPDGAWREMTEFEGAAVELFAHDLATLSYFCREVDRPSGLPVLPKMIAEGRVLAGSGTELLIQAQRLAIATLAAGPPPLDSAAIDRRRFAITDLTVALAPDRRAEVQLPVCASLYLALADFSLRAAGERSATGKAIGKALAALDQDLSDRFVAAFTSLLAKGDPALVQSLVDDVLRPYGGRLRTGFQLTAPSSWRDAPGPEQGAGDHRNSATNRLGR
jgi:hypothetical protein